MKDRILTALASQFEAKIASHIMNIEIMLHNPIAIPEHTDFMNAIEQELAIISEYEDKLAVLNKHFK